MNEKIRLAAALFLCIVFAGGLPASAASLSPYDYALLRYLHSAPDEINEDGFMLQLVYNRTLGDFFAGFCPQGSMDEFAIHKQMPAWRARLGKLAQSQGIATLRFDVDAGVYDFSRHVLPLRASGGFLISDYATPGAGTCDLPSPYYQSLQSVPSTAKFQVDAGIIPTGIPLAQDVAQQVVDSARSVEAVLTVQIASVSENGIEFIAQTRPLVLSLESGSRRLYRRDFRPRPAASEDSSAGSTPMAALRRYFFHGASATPHVEVIDMFQSGEAVLADVSFGDSGTSLFLKRKPRGWEIVGGSAGSPATAARMIAFGIPKEAARILSERRGTVIVSRPTPLRP